MSEFLNVGTPLTLKCGETVNIRELSYRDLTTLISRLPNAIGHLADLDDEDSLATFQKILTASETSDLVEYAVSLVSGLPQEKVQELGATDTLRILREFKEVSDLKELWENFTSLLPEGMKEGFSQLKQQVQDKGILSPQPEGTPVAPLP